MRRRHVSGNLRVVGRRSLGGQRGRQKQGSCTKHNADQAPERGRNNHDWLPPWAAVRQPFESAQNGLFAFIPQGEESHAARGPPRESWCGGIVAGWWNPYHMFEYFGPPPPSGGSQVMLRLGSLISQVLQWTQFCALITKRGWPPSSTHS